MVPEVLRGIKVAKNTANFVLAMALINAGCNVAVSPRGIGSEATSTPISTAMPEGTFVETECSIHGRIDSLEPAGRIGQSAESVSRLYLPDGPDHPENGIITVALEPNALNILERIEASFEATNFRFSVVVEAPNNSSQWGSVSRIGFSPNEPPSAWVSNWGRRDPTKCQVHSVSWTDKRINSVFLIPIE